jgi:hypothetical protein
MVKLPIMNVSYNSLDLLSKTKINESDIKLGDLFTQHVKESKMMKDRVINYEHPLKLKDNYDYIIIKLSNKPGFDIEEKHNIFNNIKFII